ncbi:MAG TPA: aminopeptidase P N-terminal domain-containing protein [Myxococcaceae bacterium]|nr:aminopeptidase P N-terminal domain-containing protein [Myxococcaceae bacterium]
MNPAPLLALLLLGAEPAGPAPEAPKQLPVGKYMAPSVRPEPRPIGPTGTLGADVYRKRRKALMDRLKTGATLIVNDARFEGLREGMDFYYLTGIDEPGAALLLDPSSPDPEMLFLRTLDLERGQWEGERAKLPSTVLESTSGIAEIRRIDRLPGVLLRVCGRGGLNYAGQLVAAPEAKPKVLTYYAEAQERSPSESCRMNDKHDTLARMREVKEPEEIKLMRRSIEHTAAGHARILEVLKPGMREFELKNIVEDAFRRSGSRHLAYESIVGSGPNGAILHYPKDDRTMKEGELVVVDAGAEEQYYATDVTRTYPVSGKFSPEQREIYDIVLKAQAAGIAAAKAGVTQRSLERAVKKVIDEAGYHDAFLHGCCHFVGLEVHDTGDYDAPLPAGAVLTVEPGIYLPQRGFGVRLEDEILITANGAEVLTRAIPKDPDEIERRMQSHRADAR